MVKYCPHPDARPRAVCEVCGKSICSNCAVLHKYKDRDQDKELISCPDCIAQATFKINNVNKVKCMICGGASEVISSGDGTKSPRYKCSKCGAVFSIAKVDTNALIQRMAAENNLSEEEVRADMGKYINVGAAKPAKKPWWKMW